MGKENVGVIKSTSACTWTIQSVHCHAYHQQCTICRALGALFTLLDMSTWTGRSILLAPLYCNVRALLIMIN